LRTPTGSDLNRVRVNRRGGGAEDALQFTRSGEDPIQAAVEAGKGAPLTLDWLNRQSHHFYRDNVTSAANLRWENGSIRRNGAGEDDASSEARVVKTLETEWATGMTAKTRRERLKAGDQFDGKPVTGDVLITTLWKDGARVGVANYFVNERIYSWKMPGASEGVITNAHLVSRYGGWLFKPDMAWMNLQALGFYEWGRAKRAAGVTTSASACAPKPSLLQRIAGLISTPVYAAPTPNDPGCDELHWLDGSTFRTCCDIHDLCYEKYGCTASSWWRVWTSWNCNRCNGEVVWCFSTGGTGHGPHYF
jgi:hypothetical protein